MAIIKKDAYFISSTAVNKIHCCIWQDDEKEYKGVFQIAHGVSEYIERYDEFARFLASEGYVVCGNDHLGHGKSVDSLDDLGFFAEEDGDKRMIDDMHILYSIMHKRYPDLPYYLFGHSMGSFCARVYATAFWNELSALILCGTGELPSAAVVLEEPIKFLCKKMGPRAQASNAILDKFSTLFVKDARTNKDWLSRNEKNVDAYIADPLCGAALKLGGIRDLISLANSACTDEWAYLIPPTLPILLISGAKDPIGFNGKGVINVCDNLEDAGHEPKVILYPGDRHEILNEDDRENVYNDILDFIRTVSERPDFSNLESFFDAMTE
ncbi:MAG: alpha/beta fold hydrolase [Clostridia bacterium]|nr:alpha/beta fold hydrolase [Clostridia bacterium]